MAKSTKLTPFGKYLKDESISIVTAALALEVKRQHVSTLSTGTATPSLKLAGRIEKWSKGAVTIQGWLPWVGK